MARLIKLLLFAPLLLLPQLSPAQAGPELTVELIDARVATLRGDGAADDSEAVIAYLEARTLLNAAEAFSRDSAAYLEALSVEPQREAEIQRRLDELDGSYDPAEEIAGFTAEEITARLALARAEQRELTNQLEKLDRRLAGRENSAVTIRARLDEIDRELDALPAQTLTVDPSAVPSQTEAASWRDAARRLALSTEARAQEAQLTSQPVRFSAMAAERAELSRQLEQLQALLTELEVRSASAVEAARAPAELDISTQDPAYAVALSLAQQDTALRELRLTTNERLADTRAGEAEINRRLRALEDRYATARRIVDFAGESETLGRVLLTYWEEIDDFVIDDPTRALSREVSTTVIRRIDHEEELASLLSASSFVNEMLLEAGLDPESVSPRTRGALLELARGYRERLRAIIASESEYIDALSSVESGYASLSAQIQDYREFLQGLVIWIPNHPPLWTTTLQAALEEVDFIDARLRTVHLGFSPWLLVGGILAYLLLRNRPRLLDLQQQMNSQISRPRDDSILHTLKALAAAAARAAPVPLLLLGLASLFDRGDTLATLTVSNELLVIALVLFTFSLMRIVSEPAGIGRLHFNWPAATMDRVHSELTFLIRWWLPLPVIASLANRFTPSTGDEAIGRLLMLVAILVISFHIGTNIVNELKATGSVWFRNTLNRLRIVLMLLFVTMLAAVVYGQVFSMLVIGGGLINTLWVGVGLLLTYAVFTRWLRVARRRLRLRELLAQRAQAAAAPGEEDRTIDEQVADVSDLSSETQQLVTVITIATALFSAFLIWEPLLPAVNAFSAVDLWTSTSEVDGQSVITRITLATVITVSALATLTLFAARRLPALVEIILRSRTSVSAGARYTVSTLLNYVIIGAGIIIGLGALGLQWGQLQWLVAALGVGIGFGLQEIVANFISGLIILFERPIRVGDIVTIGDKDGTVVKIRIRATTLRDWDGKELLVPNKEFITGRLLNWTLSDSKNRIIIPVGIAYGSDVERAIAILRETVIAHPRTIDDPEPLIVFDHFGDNALELSARVFLDSLEGRLLVMTELRTAINRAFEEAGIVIAFPQRDVHVDTTAPLRIALEGPGTVAAAADNGAGTTGTQSESGR